MAGLPCDGNALPYGPFCGRPNMLMARQCIRVENKVYVQSCSPESSTEGEG